MPQYDLASSRMQLGTGSRVQNMRITPELCRTWLGFVAPMLADTAEVNGEVSARVERFLWDFNVPENSDVVAQLTRFIEPKHHRIFTGVFVAGG